MRINRVPPGRAPFPRATQFAAALLFFSLFLGTPGAFVAYLRFGIRDNTGVVYVDQNDPKTLADYEEDLQRTEWMTKRKIVYAVVPFALWVAAVCIIGYRILFVGWHMSDLYVLGAAVVLLAVSVYFFDGPLRLKTRGV